MSLVTNLRQIVSIYVVSLDGSGRKVAENVEIRDAFIIAEAFEYRGLEVIIDPPQFGLMQNTISWSATENPPTAVPWRDYLEVRARHERSRETFDELYEYTPPANYTGSEYEKWEMRDDEGK
jgi:hypothetical protein